MASSKRNGFDRCPTCRGPMTFEGVANRKGWTRWTSCPVDGTWVVSDENGAVIEVSKTPPGKHQFRTGKELWGSDGE